MTGQWKNGRDVVREGSFFRDISNPRINHVRNAYTGTSDNGGVHSNSALVSYPFYLMYSRYGFSRNVLAALWYKSMRTGRYYAESSLQDVRVALIRAAKKLGMSSQQKNNIRQAFNDVGITQINGNIHGIVTDRDAGTPIQGATVLLTKENGTGTRIGFETRFDGSYSFDVEYGRYIVTVSKDNYITFKAMREIEEGDYGDFANELNVALVKEGKGNISGTAYDATTGNTLSNVTVRLREDWSVADPYARTITTQTNANGFYSMTSVDAGYYTIEASLTHYVDAFIETTIAPGRNTVNNIVLSPETSGDVYRVTLQWGANPRDLDSHLIGKLPNGTNFHVYYPSSSRRVYYNGKYVAILDHDDTQGNGFETTTFSMQPGDTFKYYVHWYAGDGTWSGSNAVVNLYKGTNLIGTYPVPSVNQHGNTAGRYWHVFELTNGLDPIVRGSSSIRTTAPTLD